ncbi:MAG: GAF domain-containing protein [Chloroflexi bacterium]|nr:GAF domain-containing protein [Chloroflexota bacterium]MBK7179171.1 GAF domain-containing protein [Chloroflexota bacterium]MBK7920077.1 GAF domain-containing protein [Chloroflexota bacterium]MBK8932188.1 GAF domain-containing protein [Chloroflexota bacterium]MBP6804385.1 GAF domain-containing protein [Chloroflexota bacterium]
MDRQLEILRTIALNSQYLSDVRNLERRLPDVIAGLGMAAGVRRVYLYENKTLPDGRILGSHRLGWSAFRQFMLHNCQKYQNLDYQAIGFAGWIARLLASKPVYGNLEDYSAAEVEFLKKEQIKSFAIIPIFSGDHCWGFVGFDDYQRERVWTAGEIESLMYVGRAVGTAFENMRLFRAEGLRRREAEILNQVSGFLTQSLDLHDALSRALDTLICHLTGELTISLTLLDEKQKALIVILQKSNHPYPPDQEIGEQIDLDDVSVSQLVLVTKRPYTIPILTKADATQERARRAITAGLSAILYLPLLVRSEVVGVLHIDVYLHPRQFSTEEITICQGIANLMAAAIERDRLQTTERQQLQLARTLQQVGALQTTRLGLEVVYQTIFSLLSQVITFDSVSIQLFDEENDHLNLVASSGFTNEIIVKNFIHSIASHCLSKFSAGQYVTIIADTYNDPRWVGSDELSYIHSWVGALLRINDRSIGILNVDSKESNAFTEQDAATIAAFANQAAIAIENARLYENARQQANELAILNEVAMVTAAIMNIDELLTQTTELLTTRLYHDSFGFVLIDEATGTAWLHWSFLGAEDSIFMQPFPMENSVTGFVAKTGSPIIVPDVSQELRYWRIGKNYQSAVAVPLQIDNRVIGVIKVESASLNAFTEDDIKFLMTLAGLVGVAIARIRLYKRLQAQSESLAEEVAARTLELQSERDRTLAILESVGESILVMDRNAVILYANQAAELQSGYTRLELVGRMLNMLESGLTPEATYAEMLKTIFQGSTWSGELVNRRKSGSTYDVSTTVTPIVNARQEIVNFVSVQADITRLKEVDRLKTKFVTNVSHELRTPLTNIKTYVTLLEMGRSENWQRYLKVLHHETDRLTQLIQDLLDLSRLEIEAVPVRPTAVDLPQIIREYIDIFAAKADIRQITLHVNVASKLPMAHIEARHLGQLLTNLLGNALNYTPPGGQIWVSAGTKEDMQQTQLWLKIADNGMGIDDADIPFLFDRFFRSDVVQTRGIPGTGLGLAICQEIVKRYNGRIEVHSTPGQGAAFTVWLPINQENKVADSSPA